MKGSPASAVSASPAASGSVLDPVRALQHALYRSAKADPGRRLHALRDKVYRRDVLWRAWVAVRRNNGAAGGDESPPAQGRGGGGGPPPAEAGAGTNGGGGGAGPGRGGGVPH